MPCNRLQHQKGLSDDTFEQFYPNEEACRTAWFARRWPEGFKCPRCAGAAYSEIRGRQLLQCRRCRYQVSLIAGTVLQGTKLPMRVWFRAMHLLAQGKKGLSNIELGRRLGISTNAAWRMQHKLMQAMLERNRHYSSAPPGHGLRSTTPILAASEPAKAPAAAGADIRPSLSRSRPPRTDGRCIPVSRSYAGSRRSKPNGCARMSRREPPSSTTMVSKNGIVEKYVDLPMHCELHHVSAPDGLVYPVIAVPGGHRSPVMAKRNGPAGGELRQRAIYIRRTVPLAMATARRSSASRSIDQGASDAGTSERP